MNHGQHSIVDRPLLDGHGNPDRAPAAQSHLKLDLNISAQGIVHATNNRRLKARVAHD